MKTSFNEPVFQTDLQVVVAPEQPESLSKRFLRMPLGEKLSILVQFLRGLFLQSKIDGGGWILAGRGVKLRKHNGIVNIDRLCSLQPSVSIAVISKDASRPAVLSIGYKTEIMDRTRINVGTSVAIGAECNISWDCDILDSDFHAILDEHNIPAPVSAPVVIEDRVWVGCNAIILKGVKIGHDSVVAAGSVVVKDVPPYSLVGGNPARVIKSIGGWTRKSEF